MCSLRRLTLVEAKTALYTFSIYCLIPLFTTTASPAGSLESHAMQIRSCTELTARMNEIKEGLSEAMVTEILGEPFEIDKNRWTYNFPHLKDFPSVPPKAGTQVFVGVSLEFKKGLVTKVNWLWVDVSGSAP